LDFLGNRDRIHCLRLHPHATPDKKAQMSTKSDRQAVNFAKLPELLRK
jgi:hypothetical protein